MATSTALLACCSRPRTILLHDYEKVNSAAASRRRHFFPKCSNSDDEQGTSSSEQENVEQENASDSENKKPQGVRMDVSNSVMRVLQGTSSEPGGGLIEANLRKRREQKQAQIPEETLSPAEIATSAFVREELFGNIDMSVPKHDVLFPVVVAATVVFNDDARESEQVLERFLNTDMLRSAVAEDLDRMQARGFLPSKLFTDMNGQPLNRRGDGDMKFEKWFLLSTYVKFKLWWSGPSSASQLGLEYAYRMSNFIFDGGGSLDALLGNSGSGFDLKRRLASRYGKLFVGKLLTKPREFLDKLQSELDKQESGRAALLLGLQGEEAEDGEVACLVTHRTSIPFLELQGAAEWLCYLLLAWAATSASLSFEPVIGPRGWEDLVVGLAMLGVLGSGALIRKIVAIFHRVSSLLSAPPLVFPVGQQGIFPTCLAYYKGCLPSRACLFDLSAASSCASLATSALFLLDSGNVQLADLRGCLLVPSDVFSYSPVLTWLLNKVSLVAAAEGGSSLLLNPLALGGLLGLNMTVFALVPLPNLDGGRILGAICGRRALRIFSGATFLLLAVSLVMSQKFLLASVWAASYLLVPEDSFQRDEVSEPGLPRTVLGLLLVLSALLCFLPVPLPS